MEQQAQTELFDSTGMYTLIIGDTTNGCYDIDSVQVNVFPNIDFFVNDVVYGCYENPVFEVNSDGLSEVLINGMNISK